LASFFLRRVYPTIKLALDSTAAAQFVTVHRNSRPIKEQPPFLVSSFSYQGDFKFRCFRIPSPSIPPMPVSFLTSAQRAVCWF